MTVDDRRLSAIERMGPTASRVIDHATYPRGCPHRSGVRITVGGMQFAAGAAGSPNTVRVSGSWSAWTSRR